MVHVPRNALTELMDRTAAHNMQQGGPVMSEAGPLVRSAAMNAPPPAPLSPEEQAELDAKAAALGILPPRALPEPSGPTLEEVQKMELPVRKQAQPTVVHTVGLPKLPDFNRIQMIDLETGYVIIDGLGFEMEPGDVRDLRAYAVLVARDKVMKNIDAAIMATLPPEQEDVNDGSDGGAEGEGEGSTQS